MKTLRKIWHSAQNRLGNERRLQKDQEPTYELAIASFPRSGNTYVRRLLENTLQVETGTLHSGPGDWNVGRADLRMQKTHFPWNGFKQNSADHFKKVIYIARNPLDCIYSLYVFQRELDQIDRIWNFDFVREHCQMWCEHVEYWEHAARTKPTLFLRYEDLRNQPLLKLREITKFLETTMDDTTLQKGVRRSSISKSLAHFQTFMGNKARHHIRKGAILESLEYYHRPWVDYVLKECGQILHQRQYIDLINAEREELENHQTRKGR